MRIQSKKTGRIRRCRTALSAPVDKLHERNVILYFVFNFNLIDSASIAFALDFIELT
ncbi:hypothetical protein LEP1GSC083_4610 [Leptospira interrogans serovar Pyrogenes str. L0374]|uniref:Uncharacterized protein n=1 Tax=Leptospira interrogans serovar Pyrogenes str. L0374 TaxID=1049928 RepID=M6K3F7_LEPIR|nr:hypothetical protein LEP1GSC197_2052 [Leptospira interrogans serovar Pomona str. CSL4002]EMN28636.1 hypothetical protein LEP1GSC083_4610 [Leptospira interrogans serovar Pyrogenes str. L0374]EMN61848.1 hypothetical protein LEP1GSC092_3083 [Leptospira interrogans serovar Pyrogenes str. R168]